MQGVELIERRHFVKGEKDVWKSDLNCLMDHVSDEVNIADDA